MIELIVNDTRVSSNARIGSQPIKLAAGVFIVLLFGVISIAVWRALTGTSPEQEQRMALARQLQARAMLASEQLAEKTKGLEATQQESIDQLQVVQDQLQTVKRLLAAQQNETKRLSEQISGLNEAIDGLRKSFASAQSSEPSAPPEARRKPTRSTRSAHRRRARSRG